MFEHNTNDSLEQVGPSFDHEMPEKVLQNKSDLAVSLYTKEVVRIYQNVTHFLQ